MKRENSLKSLLTSIFVINLIICQSVAIQAAPGDLDITFGTGGKVVTQSGFDDRINAMAIQADGKIVVAGERIIGGEKGLLARYNTDGSPDLSFGVGGFVTDAAHGGHITLYKAVAIQSDGKIVAVGYFYETGGCISFRPRVVRYNADGSRDTTFGGGDGEIELPFIYVSGCPVDSSLLSTAIENTGKIVTAGWSKNAAGNYDFAVARLNSDGSLDTTFNLDGLATFPIGSGTDLANCVAVHPTGKIVVAGYSYTSAASNNFALVMLTSSGLYDWGFGNGGKVTTDFAGNDDRAHAVIFQPDGKIVAAGQQSTPSTGVDFALARYNPNGTLDPTFDGNGKAGTVFGSFHDIIYGIRQQANGRIVAAGSGRLPADTNDNFAVARYRTDASMDTLFSVDGKLTTDFVGNNDGGRAIAIQADGKIVVAGYAFNGVESDIALTRYMP